MSFKHQINTYPTAKTASWFEYAWPREWHDSEVWPCWGRYVTVGVGFNTFTLAAWLLVFHYQPSDEDVELSAPPAPCLPGGCHAPTLMITNWTSEPVSQPQLNIVLIRVALVMVSVHSSKTQLRHQHTHVFPCTLGSHAYAESLTKWVLSQSVSYIFARSAP